MFAQGFARVVMITTVIICISTLQVKAAVEGYTVGDRSTYFTENRGQWDDRVLFKADGAGGLTWFIERDGATLLFTVADSTNSIDDSQRIKQMGYNPFDGLSASSTSSAEKYSAHALKFRFQNSTHSRAGRFLPDKITTAVANAVEPAERLTWNNNYFLGNDQSKWAPDCGNFQRVTLKNVWDGIDVTWRTEGKHVEFDFVVQPGADVNNINIACLGLSGDLSSTSDGEELLLPTSLGILHQSLPEAYQIESNGSYSTVRAQFAVGDDGSHFGLIVPEGYHPGKTLIVDPLVWSTYLGGTFSDVPMGMKLDQDGNICVVGQTGSRDYPTTAGVICRELIWPDGNILNVDGYISLLSADGKSLLFSTYLGGVWFSAVHDLVFDARQGIVIVGGTCEDFPTTENAYMRSHEWIVGDYHGFVACISNDGRELKWGTFLCGNYNENFSAIAYDDPTGGFWVTGTTESKDFPTTEDGYDRTHNGGQDGLLALINSDGSELLYGSFLGGTGRDGVNSLVVDDFGCVNVIGYTYSPDFPVTGDALYPQHQGRSDAVICRFTQEAKGLIYSSYLGTADDESAFDLVPDGDGGVVICGYTKSANFPVTGQAYDGEHNGESDGYIVHLNNELDEILNSSYFGGSKSDMITSMCLYNGGVVCFTGYTVSGDLPTTPGAIMDSLIKSDDIFVSCLELGGQSLYYSTYLGGDGYDYGTLLALDGVQHLVIGGYTNSKGMPTSANAFQRFSNAGTKNYIFKMDLFEMGFPPLMVNPNALGFDEVPIGGLAEKPVIVVNQTKANVTLEKTTCVNKQFTTDLGEDPVMLMPGSEFEVKIKFTPNRNSGNNSKMYFISGAPYADTLTVALTGKGVRINISVDTLSLEFGNVEVTQDEIRQLTIHNEGDANLRISGIQSADPAFTTDFDQLQEVAPDSDLVINVTFAPLEVRDYLDQLMIINNDPANDTVFVSLSGIGLDPLYASNPVLPFVFSCETFPNPFNSVLNLRYALPGAVRVKATVHDITGRQMATLVEGERQAGYHTAVWDAKAVPSGVYLLRLEHGGDVVQRKVVLVK